MTLIPRTLSALLAASAMLAAGAAHAEYPERPINTVSYTHLTLPTILLV